MDEKEQENLNQYSIPNNRKSVLIGLALKAFIFSREFKRDYVIDSMAENEEEKRLLTEIYNILEEERNNGTFRNSPSYEKEMRARLFDKYGITQEQTEVKEQTETKEETKEETELEEPVKSEKELPLEMQQRKLERGTIREKIDDTEKKGAKPLREDLYHKGLLCGKREDGNMPYLKISPIDPKNVVTNTFEYAFRNYTIAKIGELHYSSAPTLDDYLNIYEIKIEEDGKVEVFRKYGNIAIIDMKDPSYQTAVLVGLLGRGNLENKLLHDYIGTIAVTDREDGKGKDYKIEHSQEEYTAVIELKKALGEKFIEPEVEINKDMNEQDER